MRIAIIDIGTVTTRLLIADVNGSNVYPLEREAVITNVGEGTDATKRLKPEAIKRTVDQVQKYLDTIYAYDLSGMPVEHIMAIATSASRDAENASEFIAALKKIGVTLMVLPGQREAQMSFLGAANSFKNENLLVLDVGGGSTELIVGHIEEDLLTGAPRTYITKSESFNVGCRRMTERYLEGNPPTEKQYAEARAWAVSEIKDFFSGVPSIDRVVAVAGTATTAVSIRDKMEVYNPDIVHKSVVTREELGELYDSLAFMTLEEKQHVVGLQPERAGVIVAGFAILDAVLECAQADSFTVSETDILHGLALCNASV